MKTSARGHAQEVKSAATTERPEPGASAGATAGAARRRGPRRLLGNASSAIWVATAVLFLVSWIVQPQSVGHSSLLGMLPFAAVLAIAAMGQTLIIQQGGIDLSVPGMISITVVIMTRIPDGDSSKVIPAILLAFAVTMAAGLLAGLLVSRVGVTSIVTTLGMNALLYGGVLQISGGSPRPTTDALHNFATGTAILGIPNSVIVAIVLTAIVGFIVKQTVLGRRFEAVGASSAGSRAAGLAPARHQTGAYVGAAVMYCAAGILLAGIVKTPSAFQGDSYLLPSVAAVVLGGTSLLGGRGSVVASAVAALFLSQLDQLVLTTGVNSAIQNLVQAAALAV
ncbi:MAG TPA: ABC transporter permease, partial [Conexibacter sp.]